MRGLERVLILSNTSSLSITEMANVVDALVALPECISLILFR
jgi:3-hydroxyacyl-CoA dehydrogenase